MSGIDSVRVVGSRRAEVTAAVWVLALALVVGLGMLGGRGTVDHPATPAPPTPPIAAVTASPSPVAQVVIWAPTSGQIVTGASVHVEGFVRPGLPTVAITVQADGWVVGRGALAIQDDGRLSGDVALDAALAGVAGTVVVSSAPDAIPLATTPVVLATAIDAPAVATLVPTGVTAARPTSLIAGTCPTEVDIAFRLDHLSLPRGWRSDGAEIDGASVTGNTIQVDGRPAADYATTSTSDAAPPPWDFVELFLSDVGAGIRHVTIKGGQQGVRYFLTGYIGEGPRQTRYGYATSDVTFDFEVPTCIPESAG